MKKYFMIPLLVGGGALVGMSPVIYFAVSETNSQPVVTKEPIFFNLNIKPEVQVTTTINDFVDTTQTDIFTVKDPVQFLENQYNKDHSILLEDPNNILDNSVSRLSTTFKYEKGQSLPSNKYSNWENKSQHTIVKYNDATTLIFDYYQRDITNLLNIDLDKIINGSGKRMVEGAFFNHKNSIAFKDGNLLLSIMGFEGMDVTPKYFELQVPLTKVKIEIRDISVNLNAKNINDNPDINLSSKTKLVVNFSN